MDRKGLHEGLFDLIAQIGNDRQLPDVVQGNKEVIARQSAQGIVSTYALLESFGDCL